MADKKYSVLNMPKEKFSSYYLEGLDEYLLKETLENIKKNFLQTADSEFGVSYIDCSKVKDASSIFVEISESSFFSVFKLVVLDNFQKLSSPEKNRLMEFIRGGIGENKLVFISYPAEGRGRTGASQKKTESFFKELGCVIECSIDEKHTSSWVIEKLRREGWSIDAEAVIFLKNNAAGDFRNIINEIEKLKAFCGETQKITFLDVKTVCSESLTAQIYNMTDFISKADVSGAINAMNAFFSNEEPELSLLFYIRNYFDLLARTQEISFQNSDPAMIAKLLGKHEFVVRKNLAALSLFGSSDFAAASAILAETDFQYKKGGNKKLIFEIMMINLCRLFTRKKK